MVLLVLFSFFFFFNDTATTEIYTLSLHDALPIFHAALGNGFQEVIYQRALEIEMQEAKLHFARELSMPIDRKSTRLNSSHSQISYAVFCLKKKKKKKKSTN